MGRKLATLATVWVAVLTVLFVGEGIFFRHHSLTLLFLLLSPTGCILFVVLNAEMARRFPKSKFWNPTQELEDVKRHPPPQPLPPLQPGTVRPDIDHENAYVILGVARDADTATIRRAFRRRTQEFHPDAVENTDIQKEQAHQDFVRLSQAYEILSDPDLRWQYDELLHDESDDAPRLARVYAAFNAEPAEPPTEPADTACCGQCGAALLDRFAFCGKCGAKVE